MGNFYNPIPKHPNGAFFSVLKLGVCFTPLALARKDSFYSFFIFFKPQFFGFRKNKKQFIDAIHLKKELHLFWISLDPERSNQNTFF
jgi:hypothetical protein